MVNNRRVGLGWGGGRQQGPTAGITRKPRLKPERSGGHPIEGRRVNKGGIEGNYL